MCLRIFINTTFYSICFLTVLLYFLRINKFFLCIQGNLLSFPLPIVPSYKLCPQRAHLSPGSPGTLVPWALQVCEQTWIRGWEARGSQHQGHPPGAQGAALCRSDGHPTATAPAGLSASSPGFPALHSPSWCEGTRMCTCTHTHSRHSTCNTYMTYTPRTLPTSLQEIHHTHYTRVKMNFKIQSISCSCLLGLMASDSFSSVPVYSFLFVLLYQKC